MSKLSLEELWTTITSAFQIVRKHWRRGQYGLGVSDSQNAEWENQIQRIHQAESQIKAMLQPVPEEKKARIIQKYSAEIMTCASYMRAMGFMRQALKEYDKEKEG